MEQYQLDQISHLKKGGRASSSRLSAPPGSSSGSSSTPKLWKSCTACDLPELVCSEESRAAVVNAGVVARVRNTRADSESSTIRDRFRQNRLDGRLNAENTQHRTKDPLLREIRDAKLRAIRVALLNAGYVHSPAESRSIYVLCRRRPCAGSRRRISSTRSPSRRCWWSTASCRARTART